jgi:hypothetical protein
VSALDAYVGGREKGAKLLIAAGAQTARLYFRYGGEKALGEVLPLSEVRARAKPPGE